MKKVLIILCALMFSCSPSGDGEETPQEPKATYIIYVLDKCPEFDVMTLHGVDDANFKKVDDKIKAANTYCVSISFTDVKGKAVTGYYGGQESN